MRRIILLLALVVLAPHAMLATSILADPARKDLCGVWYGESANVPIVLDLRSTGFSYWISLSDDGRVIRRTLTWLCLPQGELRFQIEQSKSLSVWPIEGTLANRNSWEKLVIVCGGDALKTENLRIDFRRLSEAERKLGPLLASIEETEKKTDSFRIEPRQK